MQTRLLLLLTISLLSGCAERGYKVSVNNLKHTATAQYSIPLAHDVKAESKKRQKMNKSVKDALKQGHKKTTTYKKPSKVIVELSNEDEYYGNTSKYIQNVHFVQDNVIYHKFGNSELHGHVIYLTEEGEETRLNNTRIYLLSTNQKIEKWYTTQYLQDKIENSNGITLKYLNTTSLNFNQNFSFYGVAPGKYIVIIVSTIGNNFNKKVYIAKKIEIEKRKKIMAVFSKKL